MSSDKTDKYMGMVVDSLSSVLDMQQILKDSELKETPRIVDSFETSFARPIRAIRALNKCEPLHLYGTAD